MALRLGVRHARRWCATQAKAYQPRADPYVEIPRDPRKYKAFQEELKTIPGAADRGAGLQFAAAAEAVPAEKEGLEADAEYLRGVEALKWGDWKEARASFEGVRDSDGKYTHDPKLSMLIARCLIQQKEYEGAARSLKKTAALHAGVPGLADMVEEAEWGVKLHTEDVAAKQAKEDEMLNQREKEGRFTKSQIGTEAGLELLNALPLESDVKDYLRQHVGMASLERFGIVHKDEVSGRTLVAKEPIMKDALIYQDASLAFAPEYLAASTSPQANLIETPDELKTAAPRATYCTHCRGTVSRPHVCGDCGVVYCSEECQNESATTYHKYECGVFSSDLTKKVRDKLRESGHEDMLKRWLTIIRCAALSSHYSAANDDAKEAVNGQPWLSYLSYIEGEHKKNHVAKAKEEGAHKDDVDAKPTFYGLMLIAVANIMLPIKYGEKWATFPQQRRLEAHKAFHRDYDLIFDKVKMNVTKPQYVLFPVLSLVNHSCLPNAEIGAHGELRATEDIRPGQEITVSYTPKNVPVELKHYWLSKHHKFHCMCSYCTFRLQEEKMVTHLERERLGLGYIDEQDQHREEFEDPSKLRTSTGRLTRRGLNEQTSHHERLLAKYPKEFREEMLRHQERLEKELEEKPVEEVMLNLRQKKDRLNRMVKAGLLPVEQREIAAVDAALSSVTDVNES
eukprot:TRINITY_DN22181_c0_g1_i1.p1 TRINITY_DN22181_c0_g1~~TRINITY_DN22181_c0_g1_i1.p1  ORF type:complete len:680 (+),score=265.50 TRINITY_DN22181_c0_g1_i1:73-2112(+)